MATTSRGESLSESRPRPGSHRVRWTAALAAATVLTSLGLSACGTDAADDSAPSSAPETTTSPAPSATPNSEEAAPNKKQSPSVEPEQLEVAEALQFEATTVDGGTFQGASVAGRPVVLWFWAPWCSVCRSQAPEIADLTEEYGDEIAFLGVGSLDNEDAIASFAADVPGPTHLSDVDGALYQRFGVVEQSSFVVLDEQGEEVLRTGYSDDDALAGAVADLAG